MNTLVTLEKHLHTLGHTAWVVLVLSQAHPGITRVELADRCGVSTAGLQTILTRLVKLGIIKLDGKSIVYCGSDADVEKTPAEKAYTTINRVIYGHPRYAHSIKPPYSKRISLQIANLANAGIETEAHVEAYCQWWLKYKRDKAFVYGLFCCESMLSEYTGSTEYCASKRRIEVARTQDVQLEQDSRRLAKDLIHDLLVKQKKGLPFTEAEKAFIRAEKERKHGKSKHGGK